MTAREPLPPLPTWSDWQDRAEALGLRNRSGELVGPCPSCGGTDRFHVGTRRGGDALVGCRGCIDGGGTGFGTVLRAAFPERARRALDGAGGYRPDNELASRDTPSKSRYRGDSNPARVPSSKPHDTTAYARRVWDATKPLAGSLAETYLHARGVGHVAVAPSLRFSPALSHPGVPAERFPCLVAGVQDVRGDFLGVQRTYIAPDGSGKANVKPARASLGSLSGGAVRLGEPEHGRLLVGEGIESTAAAMLLFDLPGWAALGTSGLRAVELPEHVIEVVIAPDRDAAGLKAAAALARRLEAEGADVEIRRPHKGDFNDMLRERRQ